MVHLGSNSLVGLIRCKHGQVEGEGESLCELGFLRNSMRCRVREGEVEASSQLVFFHSSKNCHDPGRACFEEEVVVSVVIRRNTRIHCDLSLVPSDFPCRMLGSSPVKNWKRLV